MIDLETAARRVLSVAECYWGNDPRFFVELSCAIADLRAALERQTCEEEQVALTEGENTDEEHKGCGCHVWTHAAEDCDVKDCQHRTVRTCEQSEHEKKFLRMCLDRTRERLYEVAPDEARKAWNRIASAVGLEVLPTVIPREVEPAQEITTGDGTLAGTEQRLDGTLMARLREANSLLRSAASIASREGSQTNWRAFAGQVKKELQREHPLMYPDHAETCGDPECRFHKPDYRAFLREMDGGKPKEEI